MKPDSTRQGAAAKARMRRLRAQYRNRVIIVGTLFFIIGIVAGVFAYRWFAGRDATEPAAAVQPTQVPEVTPVPAQEEQAQEQPGDGWELTGEVSGEEIFPEDEGNYESPEGASAELDAFPEVAREEAVTSDQVEEFDPAQDEVPEEYLTLPDENGEVEAPAEEAQVEAAPAEEAPAGEAQVEAAPAEEAPAGEAQVEAAPAEETPAEEVPAEAAPAEEAPAEEVPAEAAPAEEASAEETPAGEVPAEAAPAEEAPAGEAPAEEVPAGEAPAGEAQAEPAVEEAPAGEAYAGPQVIAIVPYGESFTFSTQIKADGSARVEATDEPFETVIFTQTMKSYMRPSDFAAKYSTQYKLQGNEAGAGFELILNDYTGAATIVPQNVIDYSLRSESGNTVERGYQLMDAEIAGNYGIALETNTPKMLYKRYPYANTGEEMEYLVVTTYNDGRTQMILFQLESDAPEATPEPMYNILQRGIKSDEVASLQARLIELGYLTGAADGSFGQKTEDAIRKAQEAFGLEVTGIADNAFQQKLYEGAPPAQASASGSYETLQNGSVGEAVVKLQLRMRELGYYDGRADGGYGPMTVAAVKKAQTAFGLEATGIADDALQQRLYGAPAEEAASGEAPAAEGEAATGEAASDEAAPEETPVPEETPIPNQGAENTVG